LLRLASQTALRQPVTYVVIVSIAGVVAILCLFMAISRGLSSTMIGAGRDDRAIVLGRDADVEITSGFDTAAVAIVRNAPGVLTDDRRRPLVSGEFVRLLNVRGDDGKTSTYVVRGVGELQWTVRPELRIVQGRQFRTGAYELVVGSSVSDGTGLRVGDQIKLRGADWTVSGVFSSDGATVRDSELLADVATLQSLYNLPIFNSATVRLKDAESFDSFRAAVSTDPRVAMDAYREREFYLLQAARSTALLRFVTYSVGALMALGALFAAINAMHTAVRVRIREIATLRAIGFAAGSVIAAVLIESLAFAALGGMIGAVAAWGLVNGSTMNVLLAGSIQNEMTFKLAVTPENIIVGFVLALAIGLLGGLPGAVRAARLQVVDALRRL
jgi:putative ABC transport system permease protein